MRYADWLRFRADLFLLAFIYFMGRDAYVPALACAIMFMWRNVQAAKIVANDFVRRAIPPDQPDRRKQQ